MRTERAHLKLVFGALLAGCAGTLDDPESYDLARQESQPSATPSCADVAGVPTTILGARCATAGCHDASAGSAAMLDLASPRLHARLAGKAATGGAGVLVDVANPEASVLYTKTANLAPFGSTMPVGATALDESARACLRAWIASGT